MPDFNFPDDPNDPDEPFKVMVYMDPALRAVEALGRALTTMRENGTMSDAQLNEFLKALRLAMVSIDNDLLDVQLEYQRITESDAFKEAVASDKSPEEIATMLMEKSNNEGSITAVKLSTTTAPTAPTAPNTIPIRNTFDPKYKPTHQYRSRKAN